MFILDSAVTVLTAIEYRIAVINEDLWHASPVIDKLFCLESS